MELVEAYGPDYPIIKISEPKLVVSKMKDLHMLNSADSIIPNAQNILELYSPKTFQSGEMHLSDIYCFDGDQVFVVIDSLAVNSPPNIHLVLQKKEQFTNNLAVRSDTTTKHASQCEPLIYIFNFILLSELCLG